MSRQLREASRLGALREARALLEVALQKLDAAATTTARPRRQFEAR